MQNGTIVTEGPFESPGKTVYHVDSRSGEDTNRGTSPRGAWRSLSRVNETVFAPGDRILFKAGTSYAGALCPKGSGSEGLPVTVGMYGEGPKPRIDGRGECPEAVLLHNQEHWEIADLEITNTGDRRQPGRAGVRIKLVDFGEAHHIHLRDLFVHDVNGSNVKADEDGAGWGIVWQNHGGSVPSRFDDLLIEGCHLLRCDRNGIGGWSGFYRRDRWYPSLNVVIRGNLLEDIGGDGIVPIGAAGCLIEHNRLDGGRQRCEDYAAGIWPWSCDDSVIQFNEVSGVKGTKDGQGFDADDNCRNTLFQYNYSHENDGGFMLICSCGDAEPGSAWLRDTVIRYNISQNDGARLFHIGGPVRNTRIYNNVLYVGAELDVYAVLATEDEGWPEDIFFYNNIFHVAGKVRYEWGRSQGNVFENNVFYGSHDGRPDDPRAVTADPRLRGAGAGGVGFETLSGYMLAPDSPCIGAGRPVESNGGRDFWGNKVPERGRPDIGAHQISVGASNG